MVTHVKNVFIQTFKLNVGATLERSKLKKINVKLKLEFYINPIKWI